MKNLLCSATVLIVLYLSLTDLHFVNKTSIVFPRQYNKRKARKTYPWMSSSFANEILAWTVTNIVTEVLFPFFTQSTRP